MAGHLLTYLPDEVVEYDGVRLTSPARTWLDLAVLLTVDARGPDCPGGHRPGRRRPDSAPETQMRLALVEAGLPEPVLNHVLMDDGGVPVLWPDAAYPERGIALQYDGRHHADEEQHLRDIERQDRTLLQGWLEFRVGRQHLEGERPAVVRKVRRALQSRGWERDGR